MNKGLHYQRYILEFISAFLIVFISCSPSFSKTNIQLIPVLTISEEYSDNYFQTENDKQEEYITTYGLGFSVGFLNDNSKINLGYNPHYDDYKNLDERDEIVHDASLDGEFYPSKHTNINTHLAYTSASQDNEYVGNSWENTASISGDHQFTKNTDFNFTQLYSQRFDQQVRTGIYKEHDVNTTTAGISNQFGKQDEIGLNFSYEFDDYKKFDADEYEKYSYSGFITYWLTPLNGLDSNISYEKTDFDNSNSDRDTYTGDIRYLRKFSKHFDGYVKYRHFYSKEESGNHTIYNPSVGFDWEVTEDSGVSLGIGILRSEWDNDNEDSTDPFLEMDVFKTFDFSKHGSLYITGSSGYDAGSEDAESLGYTIYYRAGFLLDYQFLKTLSSNIVGSYERNDYKEPSVNRQDNTLNIGGGITWTPLKWLQFNLTYSYIDFSTDAVERGDYTENRAMFSVSIIPAQPIRLNMSSSRQSLEKEIYKY